MWADLRRILTFPTLLFAAGVAASFGQQAALTVTVVYGSDPHLGAHVVIPEAGLSGVTTLDGKVFFRVRPGTYTVVARLIGYPACRTTVAVPPEGTSVTLTCGLAGGGGGGGGGSGSGGGGSDIVQVVDATLTPFVGLFDVGTDLSGTATCANDALAGGVATITMPGNAMPSASGTPCRLTALLLAPDRAPFYESATANVPWTAAMGDVYSPAAPAGKVRLPIKLFVNDPGLDASERATLVNAIRTTHLVLAQQVLDNSYAGLELTQTLAGGVPDIQDLIATDGNTYVALLEGGCLKAAQIRVTPAIYDAGRLNVYYVHGAHGEDGGSKAGYSCGTSDAPDIIFLDAEAHRDLTLAHEIGHSLGLTRPDWGHADFYGGVYGTNATPSEPLNVMVDGVVSPSTSTHFSIGQVAWMHLNAESWLNRGFAGGTSARAQQLGAGAFTTGCGCPESGATDHCPSLATDIDRTPLKKWDARPPTEFNPGCSVALTSPPASAPTVTLCANGTAAVEATAHAADGTAAKGSGKMWVSLSPGVVTGTLVSSGYGAPFNLMKGTLTGVAPGVAIVRAYYGGAFSPITVTVTPPC